MVEPDRVARIVAETAADQIMPRFRRLETGDIRHKSPGDVVTVADEAAERMLTQRLGDLLPGSKVVGEEAAAADPGVVDLLAGDDPVWIVDPIDGTTNFAAGLPLFAVMVGLAQAGSMRLACIHDPVHGHMALASDGDGATLDGHAMTVAQPTDPDRMTGTVKLRFGDRALPMRIVERCQRVPPFMDLRCAGLEYLALASGQLHYALYRKLLPWDHVAGQLLHREAGGFSRHLDGGPYRVDGPTSTDGFMLAPDEASWQAIHKTLIADD